MLQARIISTLFRAFQYYLLFTFRQLGTHFIKDGNNYTVKTPLLMSQARKANINVIIENKRAAYTFYS